MPARRKKLVLTYVDSLRTDMLARAVAEQRAPTFGALLERSRDALRPKSQRGGSVEIPDELRAQLRSLGYLR